MGYIKEMYGYRDKEFIEGFLAAMDTYAVWRNGKRWIGSPEQELKLAMKNAVKELGGNPEDWWVEQDDEMVNLDPEGIKTF